MNTTQSTWHHIRRSPFQSLTAILIMVITFFSLTTFIVISDGMSSVLKYFETKPEVTIYLKDGLDKNTMDNLQKELSNYPNVKEIKFISKEKALSIYKEQNESNPMLTEMVTASILPASFEVSVSDPSILEQIAQNFSAKTSVVDEIIYQKDMIESILNWTDIIRKSGIIIVSITAIISFLVTSVVIGMKITNRKEEIVISRLLGASKHYVKKSFLLEGVYYGIFGSLIGTGISYAIFYKFTTNINTFFQPITFIRSEYSLYGLILLSEVILGTIIGYTASWFGAKRYIKF